MDVGKELTRSFDNVHRRIDDLSRLVLAQSSEIERLQRQIRPRDPSPPRRPHPDQFNSDQTIFIRNLTSKHTEEWIREEFGTMFGRILKIYIPRREDGETVHGVVHFENPNHAADCLSVADDL